MRNGEWEFEDIFVQIKPDESSGLMPPCSVWARINPWTEYFLNGYGEKSYVWLINTKVKFKSIIDDEKHDGIITGVYVAEGGEASIPLVTAKVTDIWSSVPLSFVVVPEEYKMTLPSPKKIHRRIQEFYDWKRRGSNDTNIFNTNIAVKGNDNTDEPFDVFYELVDGYTAYLVCRMFSDDPNYEEFNCWVRVGGDEDSQN